MNLSIDSAFAILREIGKNPDQNLSEIARNLGFTKPRTMRMLRSLEQLSAVQKSKNGGFKLGTTMLLLGTAASDQLDLVRAASPLLEKLATQIGETVQLRIRDGIEAVCVAKFEPPRDLRVNAVIGRRRPIYAGSSKLFLAFGWPELVRQVMSAELTGVTERTITSHRLLKTNLDKIRAQGFCLSFGEVSNHICSAAVPILGIDGVALAVINVSAPQFRTETEDLERYVELLKKAANSIRLEL